MESYCPQMTTFRDESQNEKSEINVVKMFRKPHQDIDLVSKPYKKSKFIRFKGLQLDKKRCFWFHKKTVIIIVIALFCMSLLKNPDSCQSNFFN